MSALIVEVNGKYVGVCADCKHTNVKTGEEYNVDYPKIEKLSEHLYVGHCGYGYTIQLSMKVLKKMFDNKEFDDSTIDGAIENLKNIYGYLLNKEPEIEKYSTTKFAVIGRLKDGKAGYAIIEKAANGVYSSIIKDENGPMFSTFHPSDVPKSNMDNIVLDTRREYYDDSVPNHMEQYMKKSIEKISRVSKTVSEESIFYLYENID